MSIADQSVEQPGGRCSVLPPQRRDHEELDGLPAAVGRGRCDGPRRAERLDRRPATRTAPTGVGR